VFRQGLPETGFVEGQSLTIAFRWAEGHYDDCQTLAAELVGLRVAVLSQRAHQPPALAPGIIAAIGQADRIAPVTSASGHFSDVAGLIDDVRR
jgi:hypothetical protein